MRTKQEERHALLPQNEHQTILEKLKARKKHLQANLKFYGQVENAYDMGDEFYSYFDESMREIGMWSFGRRLVQIALLLMTFVGVLLAALAFTFRHISLAILIIPITASFAVLNSLIELTSDIYNYFKTPKEQRTELHQYKLMTAPVSTLLIGGILAASVMIGLAVPGGFIALALAFSTYLIFKLCQGCIAKSMREQGRHDVVMELFHINKEIAKLEKHKDNNKEISLTLSPSVNSLYESAKSEVSEPIKHEDSSPNGSLMLRCTTSSYASAKSETSTNSRSWFFQYDSKSTNEEAIPNPSYPTYVSDAELSNKEDSNRKS